MPRCWPGHSLLGQCVTNKAFNVQCQPLLHKCRKWPVGNVHKLTARQVDVYGVRQCHAFPHFGIVVPARFFRLHVHCPKELPLPRCYDLRNFGSFVVAFSVGHIGGNRYHGTRNRHTKRAAQRTTFYQNPTLSFAVFSSRPRAERTINKTLSPPRVFVEVQCGVTCPRRQFVHGIGEPELLPAKVWEIYSCRFHIMYLSLWRG